MKNTITSAFGYVLPGPPTKSISSIYDVGITRGPRSAIGADSRYSPR